MKPCRRLGSQPERGRFFGIKCHSKAFRSVLPSTSRACEMMAEHQADPLMKRQSKSDSIAACPRVSLSREKALPAHEPDHTHTEVLPQKVEHRDTSTSDRPNWHNTSQNDSVTAVFRRPLLTFIWNCVQVFAPIAFIGKKALGVMKSLTNWLAGLAVASALLDGKPESPTGRNVQAALLLSPTIFPIVFTALVGNFMKVLALYRSQTGLEIRVGCQNIYDEWLIANACICHRYWSTLLELNHCFLRYRDR